MFKAITKQLGFAIALPCSFKNQKMRLLKEFQTQVNVYMLMGCSAQLAETLALIIIGKTNRKCNE